MRFLAVLSLLPLSAFAETYHFAACTLSKTGDAWQVASAVDATREAVSGVSVKVAQLSGDSGGYCAILLGTGDETSADVLVDSATGTGISVSPSCEFRGQIDDSKSDHQVLGYGQTVSVNVTPVQRIAIYFASPAEAGGNDWVAGACKAASQVPQRRIKAKAL